MGKKKIIQEQQNYKEAMLEIETIISDIEQNPSDIDLLTEKLERATKLLQLCKDKIFKTEQDIHKILRDI